MPSKLKIFVAVVSVDACVQTLSVGISPGSQPEDMITRGSALRDAAVVTYANGGGWNTVALIVPAKLSKILLKIVGDAGLSERNLVDIVLC